MRHSLTAPKPPPPMPLALQDYDAPPSSVTAPLGARVAPPVASGEQAGAQLWFAGVHFTLRGPAELLAAAAGLPYSVVLPPLAPPSAFAGAAAGVSCQVDLAV